MRSFETIRARLERRQRFVRGLAFASWALMGSLGTTMLALLGSALGVWNAVSFFAWIIANALVGAIAFVLGWLRPVRTVELLFRVDRQLHTNERLVTLYELRRGHGPQEFLPLLERQLDRLSMNLAQAIPLGGQRRWAAVALLFFACVGMTDFVWSGLFVAPPSQSSQSETASPENLEHQRALQMLEWLQTPPAELVQKLASVRERLERARAALMLNPNDPRARAALQQLHTELIQEQQRFVPPLPPADQQERPNRSNTDASLAEEGSLSKQRSHQQSTSRAPEFDRLLQSLRSLSGHAQSLSPEELQRLLEQLRETDPEAAALAEQISRLDQTPEEFRERLEELLRELEARQALREQLENLQREIESALGPTEPQPGHEELPTGGAMSSREEGSSQAQQQRQQGSASEARGIQPHEQEGQPSAGSGRGTAPLDPEAAQDLPDLSQLRERSRALSVPGSHNEELEILFEIITLELPQESEASPRPSPVQIDYDRVEAVLDMLDIPEELRDAVRQYFLSLSRDQR